MGLPGGTITFLFTDIEGSTRLWEQYPEAMPLFLERHNTLLRNAIEGHHGAIFKTVGDAFCVAFSTAHEALAAGLEAQRALQAENWDPIGALNVRMALHTGVAQEKEGDYFGPTLNRVARLLALGYGGQVLLSGTSQGLVRDRLPEGASLKDLGLHRLRDLSQPEQVFQLLHPDLPATFPPLLSLDALPTNLLVQLTSFVGREKEIEEIEALLQRTHLLTLTGSGGCGKTRLALQVMADLLGDYSDGVWVVEMAALADPALVPQTVAATLGVKEEAGKTLNQTLCDYLRPRRLVLMLDNCEHLLSACAQLADVLLHACPQVKLLATSREGLGIAGETTYRVPSLSLPEGDRSPTAEDLFRYEAVRLFVDRAMAVAPAFRLTDQNAPALASVCLRLDGIPLALELAAARLRSLSIEEINARLDNRFRLLTGGSRTALPRQQTLRAMIDWSYDLLSEPERLLLHRLAVFAGGWFLEAAEQACSGEGIEAWEILDLLAGLVEKSLVLAEPQQERTRYRLMETVRQYARDRMLESGYGAAIRDKHRDYFLALAEEVKPQLEGPNPQEGYDRLQREHDNLRAAIAWCLEDAEGAEAALRLTGAVGPFWMVRGYWREGREHLQAALAREGAAGRTAVRGRALNIAAALAYQQSDYAAARSLHEESLAIQQELGNKKGIAGSLNNLGMVAADQGDYEQAAAYYTHALALNREIGNRAWEAANLDNLSNLAVYRGDYTQALVYKEQALVINRETGHRAWEAGNLSGLAYLAQQQGDNAQARAYYEQALAIHRQIGDRARQAYDLNGLGTLATDQGDYAQARAFYEQSLILHQEVGDQKGASYDLERLGLLALDQGDYEQARGCFEQAMEIIHTIGYRGREAFPLFNLGLTAWYQGDRAAARSYYEQALLCSRENGNQACEACCLTGFGDLAMEAGDYPQAHAFYNQGLELRQTLGQNGAMLESLRNLAALAVRQRQFVRAAQLYGAAEALREQEGIPLSPVSRAEKERDLAAMRQALREESFTAAWERGQGMTIEQAIRYAGRRQARRSET